LPYSEEQKRTLLAYCLIVLFCIFNKRRGAEEVGEVGRRGGRAEEVEVVVVVVVGRRMGGGRE
jgi:hypothetical protein